MDALETAVTAVARDTDFSGVVRVERANKPEFVAAFGLADRAHEIRMTTDRRLAIASGSKGFTALAVMSLVEEGCARPLDDGTVTARSGPAARRRRRHR